MSYANFAHNVGLRVNYSLYSIPTAWVIGMAPIWWAVGAASSAYDNSAPAESWANLEKSGVNPTLATRIRRAVAANKNCESNNALFAACLVGANAAKVPVRFLHICAGVYLTSRSLYTLAYINIDDTKSSFARTLLYWTGVGSSFALVIKAAELYRNSPW